MLAIFMMIFYVFTDKLTITKLIIKMLNVLFYYLDQMKLKGRGFFLPFVLGFVISVFVSFGLPPFLQFLLFTMARV